MKLAISSKGDSLQSPVDPRFGRAVGFIVFDTEDGSFQAVDNSQNLNAVQGAGTQAAETVANLGAEYLLTGHCGPKAFRALSAAGVKVCNGAEGTVAQAVEQFQSGALTPSESADVEGHR